MIVTSYWLKWSDACDFLAALMESEDHDDVQEKVDEIIDDRYHSFAPYGPREDDTIVFASRFEQDVMDVIDEMGDVPHRVVRVESPE